MPNIKSAKKRVRVAAYRTQVNKARKSELRTLVKKTKLAVETNAEDKHQCVKAAIKKLDQAVAKGTLHKNTAARKKSALAVALKNSDRAGA